MAGERILLVEDSATQREAARAILEAEGYTVATAPTGEAALELAGREAFALILSDVVMPGMSGFDLCRRIKREVPNAPPVVLLTGLSDPRDIVRGVECGADNYITKPYDGAQLRDRIRSVLDNEALQRDAPAEGPLRIQFLGETYTIHSDPARILALLLSSFEELSRTNTALQKSKLKAEAATRARDEVLATVSHDLRNPVGTIFTSSTLLLEVELGEEARRRQIDVIKRSAQRMDRLIQDLLDVSRIDSGRFSVDPTPEVAHSLIAEAHELHATMADARTVQLIEDAAAPGLNVLADRGRVLQVFANLISNALRFTSPGGSVTLRAVGEGEHVRFDVQDTGSGISPEDLPRVFERFWHTATGGGTGLGLAIARGIVEAHGGTISVTSSSKGSTFSFTIPVHRASGQVDVNAAAVS